MAWLRSGFALLVTACMVVACSAEEEDGATSPDDSTGEALTSSKSVSLMYEGTCAFLHHCSSYSRKLPGEEVQWGCGGTTCDDTDLWMAGPSRTYCNKKVKVCRGSKCATATVKDISDAHGWEGSNGLLDALDLEHDVNVNACSGSGGGKVTVKVQ